VRPTSTTPSPKAAGWPKRQNKENCFEETLHGAREFLDRLSHSGLRVALFGAGRHGWLQHRDRPVQRGRPNGNDKIFVGGSGPNAVDPTTNGGNDTPEQQEEKKKQCLANCAVQDTVNKNNCTIANAQFAAKLTTVPLWTAVTGGFASLLLTKNPLIAGGGAIGGAALGYLDVQMRVKDQLSFCLAVAARDNNDCIKNTCHAWMLPLALLPLRRRYNEKVKEAQA
jgi:hypothetical protein